MVFNGQRLKVARNIRCMASTKVAEEIGVTKQAMWQYENNSASPSLENVNKLTNILGFPLKYFYGEDLETNKMGEGFCRASVATIKRAKEKEKLKNIFRLKVYEFLQDYLNFPYIDIPDNLHENNQNDPDYIEKVAEKLRKHLGLGCSPIENMVYLLENMGFMLSTYEYDKTKFDALSQIPSLSKPYIKSISYNTLNTTFSRIQFTLAHELGHWVLRHLDSDELDYEDNIYMELEREANMFAGAFLLPRKAFIEDLTSPNDLNCYVVLKKKWKVSVGAMIYRAHSLNIIDAEEYHNLYRKLSRRGWRTAEPYDNYFYIPKPTIFKKAFDVLNENSIIAKESLLSTLQQSCEYLYASQYCELLGLEDGYIQEYSHKYLPPYLELIK